MPTYLIDVEKDPNSAKNFSSKQCKEYDEELHMTTTSQNCQRVEKQPK